MKVPAWRIAAGAAILVALLAIGGSLAPVYFRNLQLQEYVRDLSSQSATLAEPEDQIRAQIVEKASALRLPVGTDDVTVVKAGGGLNVNFRYVVKVTFPLYTVDLHFSGSASQ